MNPDVLFQLGSLCPSQANLQKLKAKVTMLPFHIARKSALIIISLAIPLSQTVPLSTCILFWKVCPLAGQAIKVNMSRACDSQSYVRRLPNYQRHLSECKQKRFVALHPYLLQLKLQCLSTLVNGKLHTVQKPALQICEVSINFFMSQAVLIKLF